MERYDVFNGDADGIFALHQLRLHQPASAHLITGVKRDIALGKQLGRITEAEVVFLDVSFAENREAVAGILERGGQVRYFDHHLPGEIITHPALDTHIDTSPDVCTSLLVNRFLDGQFLPWAIAAAYGDSLPEAAQNAAISLGLSPEKEEKLGLLGTLVNYNAYGETLEDLHFHPARLYQAIKKYDDPFDCLEQAVELEMLAQAFEKDMARTNEAKPLLDVPSALVLALPDQPWAGRIIGVWAHQLAELHPQKITALVRPNQDGSLRVSLRTPKAGTAGEICKAFGGGGRKTAGGITALPPKDLQRLLSHLKEVAPS